jgi:hypothetical protein
MFRIISKDENKMAILRYVIEWDEISISNKYAIMVDGEIVYESDNFALTAQLFDEVLKKHKEHLIHEQLETTVNMRELEKNTIERNVKEYDLLISETLTEQNEVVR